MKLKALIQARMSSSRYPGKVLAPLKGKPLILHVYDKVNLILPKEDIIVITSFDISDEPLAAYLESSGINLYRGPLSDVFTRFRDCLGENPCDFFFRVCGDSPLLDESLFTEAIDILKRNDQVDVITNKFPQTFPPGKSLELIRSETFFKIETDHLTKEEKEHVTKVFYNHSQLYNIYNIENENNHYKLDSYAVDEVHDLKILEKYLG